MSGQHLSLRMTGRSEASYFRRQVFASLLRTIAVRNRGARASSILYIFGSVASVLPGRSGLDRRPLHTGYGVLRGFPSIWRFGTRRSLDLDFLLAVACNVSARLAVRVHGGIYIATSCFMDYMPPRMGVIRGLHEHN